MEELSKIEKAIDRYSRPLTDSQSSEESMTLMINTKETKTVVTKKADYFNEMMVKTEENRKEFKREQLKETLVRFTLYIVSNIVNLAAILHYIIETTLYTGEDEQNYAFETAEFFISLYFLGEYLLILNRASQKLAYIFSFESMIDIVTIIPVMFNYFFFALVDTGFIRIFRIFRVFRVLRIYKSFKYYQEDSVNMEDMEGNDSTFKVDKIKIKIMKIIVVLISFFFIGTGTVIVLQDLVIGSFSKQMNFFEALYMVITTFTTIGYGDILPTHTISRLALVLGLIIIVTLVSGQLTELGYLISILGPGLFVYSKTEHIVLICDDTVDLETFLYELKENDENKKREILIISKATINLPSREYPFDKVFLMPVKLIDLDVFQRANIKEAESIFIFSAKSVHKCKQKEKLIDFVLLKMHRMNVRMPIYVQTLYTNDVYGTQIKRNASNIPTVNYKTILPCMKIKSMILAKSGFNPGFCTFACNLAMNDYTPPQTTYKLPMINKAYVTGCQYRIIVTRLPNMHKKAKFDSLVRFFYNFSVDKYRKTVFTDSLNFSRPIMLLGLVKKVDEDEEFIFCPQKFTINKDSSLYLGIYMAFNKEQIEKGCVIYENRASSSMSQTSFFDGGAAIMSRVSKIEDLPGTESKRSPSPKKSKNSTNSKRVSVVQFSKLASRKIGTEEKERIKEKLFPGTEKLQNRKSHMIVHKMGLLDKESVNSSNSAKSESKKQKSNRSAKNKRGKTILEVSDEEEEDSFEVVADLSITRRQDSFVPLKTDSSAKNLTETFKKPEIEEPKTRIPVKKTSQQELGVNFLRRPSKDLFKPKLSERAQSSKKNSEISDSYSSIGNDIFNDFKMTNVIDSESKLFPERKSQSCIAEEQRRYLNAVRTRENLKLIEEAERKKFNMHNFTQQMVEICERRYDLSDLAHKPRQEYLYERRIINLEQSDRLFEKHILLVGMQSNMGTFIKMLKVHYSGRDICIMVEEGDKEEMFKLLKNFNNLYILKGDILNPSHLKKAYTSKAEVVFSLVTDTDNLSRVDYQKVMNFRAIEYFFDSNILMETWNANGNKFLGFLPLDNDKEITNNEFFNPNFMAGKLIYLDKFEKVFARAASDRLGTEAWLNLMSLGYVNSRTTYGDNKVKLSMPIIVSLDIPDKFVKMEYFTFCKELLATDPPIIPLGLYVSNPSSYGEMKVEGRVTSKTRKQTYYESLKVMTSYKRKIKRNKSLVDKEYDQNADILKSYSHNGKLMLDYMDWRKNHLPVFITNPPPNLKLNKGTKVMVLVNHKFFDKSSKTKTIRKQRTMMRRETLKDEEEMLEHQNDFFKFYKQLKTKYEEMYDKTTNELRRKKAPLFNI